MLSLSKLGKQGLIALLDPLKGVFYQYGDHQTLWFIASLYLYSLVFHFVDVCAKTPKRLLGLSVLLIIFNQILLYILHCPVLPWRLHCCMWACGIMGIGKVYRQYEHRVDKTVLKWPIVSGCLLAYFCLITYGKVSVNFWGHPNWLYASALPLTGMTVMLYLSKHVTVNSKALLYVGANTLVYFALHRQILQLVERLFVKMQQGFSIEASIVTNLLEVLVIALLLVVPTFLINKYIPQVTGKGWKLWK